MPKSDLKKIVYLFGAGATHAELTNLDPDLLEENTGLLMGSVSSRVIEKARRGKKYLKDVETVSGTSGSLNIELLISLIENSKIRGWEYKTHRLKELVKKDIKGILTPGRIKRFYLHKALFEYHEQASTKNKEELTGLISMNYDEVVDQAYKLYFGRPNYCFSLETGARSQKNIPLLKLHGSFNWNRRTIRGRQRTIEIIPMGSNKSYLHAPYGFIWNRALEILIGCDTLRVIGCSLSQNDAHLVDLLFKAQLERLAPFGLEIIDSVTAGEQIRRNYGFFPSIETLAKIGGVSGADSLNAFKAWLKDQSIRVPSKEMAKTRYLRKV